MQTLDETDNWNEVETSRLLNSFRMHDNSQSLCRLRVLKRKSVLCITVVYNFKKLKQKACVKQQIMCDYDDSLFTRGRLESHLGSSYD